MLARPIRMIVVLAAAAGIPYVWFNPELAGKVKQRWRAWSAKRTSAAADGYDFGARFTTPALDSGITDSGSEPFSPQLTGQVMVLDEVLRFDVSPSWVLQRWSRVSTIEAEEGLEGLRVPLVTGIELQDLAGSLTYYFDSQQQLRRISFHGRTGDEHQLVGVVTRQFNLRREPGLGAGMYVARWNGKPTSVLRISHAPVIRAQTPHERFQVVLELNRPAVGYGLSPASAELLNPHRLTQLD